MCVGVAGGEGGWGEVCGQQAYTGVLHDFDESAPPFAKCAAWAEGKYVVNHEMALSALCFVEDCIGADGRGKATSTKNLQQWLKPMRHLQAQTKPRGEGDNGPGHLSRVGGTFPHYSLTPEPKSRLARVPRLQKRERRILHSIDALKTLLLSAS